MAGRRTAQYNTAMRKLLILIPLLIFGGCTSMLLGGGSQGDRRPSTSTAGSTVTADDQSISGSIRIAFERDEDIRQYAIGVGTSNRVVTLSGTVGSYGVRDRAVDIAKNTSGVREVRNRIVVNTNM